MTQPSAGGANHDISLAVWDVPSPVVVGRRQTIKVGVTCPAGCSLAGTRVEVRDAGGVLAGGGDLGVLPWPGSDALYWAEIDVHPPDSEGDHAWTVHASASEPAHAGATSSVRFVACGRPEHRVTLEAVAGGNGAAVPGVELRVGRFRAATNEAGIGQVEVPRGTYDVETWKNGYQVVSKTVTIAADTTIRLELIAVPELERPYWM
jgi:hypothetical protein